MTFFFLRTYTYIGWGSPHGPPVPPIPPKSMLIYGLGAGGLWGDVKKQPYDPPFWGDCSGFPMATTHLATLLWDIPSERLM